MKIAALLSLLALSTVAMSAEVETQSQKTIGGFSGLLIITPDKDWEAKWNTSPEAIPYSASGSTVKKGGQLFVLTMFANPQLDTAGAASVSMDIDVLKPDGSSSTHAENAVCSQDKVQVRLGMYLCRQVVEFVGEVTDPVGTWTVRITLKDEVGKISLPLSATFKLVSDGDIV
jgi:hypothetical protein